MLTLAIDFDGTLVERGDPLRWRHAALETLRVLAAAGHRLILHSCRCNPIDPTPAADQEIAAFYRWGTPPPSAAGQWQRFRDMRAFLRAAGAWDLFAEVWQAPGKPICDLYIEDRMEAPNWVQIAYELGVP